MTSNEPARPTFRQLLDWAEGRLDPQAAARLEEQAAGGDEETRRTITWIRSFLEESRRQPLEGAPPIIRQRLRQAFASRAGAAQEVERLVAELTFDSRLDPELVGVRTVSGDEEYGGPYQLAFRAGAIDILVDVSASSGTYLLEGQVFAPDQAAEVWVVTAEYAGTTRTDIGGDELGSFSVAGIPGVPQRLSLSNGVLEIDIPLAGTMEG